VTPAQLLDALAAHGIELRRGMAGRPRLFDPEAVLDPLRLLRVLWDRWLLEWAIVGSRSGHRWHRCPECGELQLLRLRAPSESAKHCVMTPGCAGVMAPIPFVVPAKPRARKVRIERVPLPPKPPPRPKHKRQGSHTPIPRAARAGDELALVRCDVHRSNRVLVKAGLVESWRCPLLLDNGTDNECARRAQLVARFWLNQDLHPAQLERRRCRGSPQRPEVPLPRARAVKYFDVTRPELVNPVVWTSLPEVAEEDPEGVVESTLKFLRYLGCSCERPSVTVIVEVVSVERANTAVHVEHADSCALFRRARYPQN
jgi:hypothetical protein